MSVSHPFDSSAQSVSNTLQHVADTDAPIKPFRLPAKVAGVSRQAQILWASIYNDKKELTRCLSFAAGMMGIIAGSVLAKKPFTIASLVVVVVSILLTAFTDAWAALILFLFYLSMEGLFKYTTLFSPAVYIIAPFSAALIYVAWQISFRNKMIGKENKNQAKTAIDSAPITGVTDKEFRILLPKFSPLVFAFLGLGVIQCLNPDAPGIFSSFVGSFVWYIAPAMMFFVTYFVLQKFKQSMELIYAIVCTGFVVCAYAVVQYQLGGAWCYAHIPGLDSINKLEWYISAGSKVESGVFRPASTAASAGGYAILAAYSMFAAFTVFIMPRMILWRRVLALLALPVIGIGLIISGVRQLSLVVIVVTPIYLALLTRNLRDAVRIYTAAFSICFILAGAFFITDSYAKGKFSRRYANIFTRPVEAYQQNRGVHFVDFTRSVALRPFGVGVWRGTKAKPLSPSTVLGRRFLPLENRETQWNALQIDLGVLAVIVMVLFLGGINIYGIQIVRSLKNSDARVVAMFLLANIMITTIGTFGYVSLQGNYYFWVFSGALLALPGIVAADQRRLLEAVKEGEKEAANKLPAVA